MGEVYKNAGREFSTADVKASPLRVSRPRTLFPVPFAVTMGFRGRNYDPLPDGTGFIMVEHTSDLEPAGEIRFVTGWLEELENKTRSPR